MKFVFIDSLPCIFFPSPFPLPGPPGCLSLPCWNHQNCLYITLSPSASQFLLQWLSPLSSDLVLLFMPPLHVGYITLLSLHKFLLTCMKETERILTFVPVTVFRFSLLDVRRCWRWSICICDYITLPSHNGLYLQVSFSFSWSGLPQTDHILINNSL